MILFGFSSAAPCDAKQEDEALFLCFHAATFEIFQVLQSSEKLSTAAVAPDFFFFFLG